MATRLVGGLMSAAPVEPTVAPNPVEPEDDVPFFAQEYAFDTWIQTWLNGSLQQPWLIYHPETHTYRGATIAETQSALEPDT